MSLVSFLVSILKLAPSSRAQLSIRSSFAEVSGLGSGLDTQGFCDQFSVYLRPSGSATDLPFGSDLIGMTPGWSLVPDPRSLVL